MKIVLLSLQSRLIQVHKITQADDLLKSTVSFELSFSDMPLSAQPLSAAQLSELQAQHSLQGEDWLSICTLSEVEGIFESAQSWSFEEFLGFTLHLFITTDAPHVRAQVAQKLPKFGSRIVLPLLKILHHFQAIAHTQTDAQTSALASDVSALAAQSLSQIAPSCLALPPSERSDSMRSQISEPLSKENQPCRETQRRLSKKLSELSCQNRTELSASLG